MGLFREKNRAFDPLEVARVLRQSFVNRPANDLRGELTIPSGAAESVFEPKAFFFRLASTIPALLVQEENYPRVSEAREALEALVFGKRYRECISEEGIPKNEEMGKSFKEPLETLIFENHHAEQGQGEKVFLNLFRMAMRSFATLIAPENKYAGMRWAREWLTDIGVEERNPVKLQRFSWSWQLHHIAVLEYINAVAKECRL